MTREQEAEQQKHALQDQLEQLIESARADIERAIAIAESQQHEGQGAEQIEALKSQLTALDSQSALVRGGSMLQLSQLQTTLPASVNAIRTTSQTIISSAGFEQGLHMVEMSLDKIQAMERAHASQSAAFTSYEAQSASRIDQLAAANGIDLTGYRQNRANIQTEIEEAKKRGDMAAQYFGEAKLAGNNVFGLIKAGADDAEIERGLKEKAAAEERYLFQREKAAKEAGKAAGLTGADLRAYIDAESLKAANELQIENEKLADKTGLSDEQKEKAGLYQSIEQLELEQARNHHQQNGTIKSTASATLVGQERVEVQTTKNGMKTLLASNGFTVGKTSLSPEEADIAPEKQPTSVPTFSGDDKNILEY